MHRKVSCADMRLRCVDRPLRASEFVELKQEPWLFSPFTLTGARLGLCCEADDRYGARPGTLVEDSSDSGASNSLPYHQSQVGNDCVLVGFNCAVGAEAVKASEMAVTLNTMRTKWAKAHGPLGNSKGSWPINVLDQCLKAKYKVFIHFLKMILL